MAKIRWAGEESSHVSPCWQTVLCSNTPPLGCSVGIFTTAEALAGLFQFPGLCKQTGTWGDCPEAYKSHAKTWDKQISNNYREAFCLPSEACTVIKGNRQGTAFPLLSCYRNNKHQQKVCHQRSKQRFKQLSSLSQSHSRRKKPE